MFRLFLLLALVSRYAFAGMIDASLFYQDSVSFGVQVDAGYSSLPDFAEFQDDHLLTVTGGSGGGSILPCMFSSWDNFHGLGALPSALASAA